MIYYFLEMLQGRVFGYDLKFCYFPEKVLAPHFLFADFPLFDSTNLRNPHLHPSHLGLDCKAYIYVTMLGMKLIERLFFNNFLNFFFKIPNAFSTTHLPLERCLLNKVFRMVCHTL